MSKHKYDIEIANSSQVSGGFLMTTEPMTEKQALALAEKLGRELLREGHVTYVSYWLNREDDEEFEEMLHVSVSKVGRRVYASKTKNGLEIK